MVDYSKYSLDELMECVQKQANACARVANQIFNIDLTVPVVIDWDLCEVDPKAAGMAYGSRYIAINKILLEDDPCHVINDTVPHEIAHLAQVRIFDEKGTKTQGHGVEWREVMKKTGRNPEKYHKIDVTRAVAYSKDAKKKKKQAAKGDAEDED